MSSRRRPLVDEGLHVGLREHPAAGGDGVQGRVAPREGVQPRGVGLQQARHLVDERAGAPGACPVHSLLQAAGEIGDLRILAAQLYGDVGIGDPAPHGARARDDLLHEGKLQPLRHGEAAATGHGDGEGRLWRARARSRTRREGLVGGLDHADERAADVRPVAFVGAVDHGVALIEDGELHGGGADVDAGVQELGPQVHEATGSRTQ